MCSFFKRQDHIEWDLSPDTCPSCARPSLSHLNALQQSKISEDKVMFITRFIDSQKWWNGDAIVWGLELGG